MRNEQQESDSDSLVEYEWPIQQCGPRPIKKEVKVTEKCQKEMLDSVLENDKMQDQENQKEDSEPEEEDP